MRVSIKRCYYPTGTNGIISVDGSFECCSIELPMKGNKPRESCIAEGDHYTIIKRYSKKHGDHMYILGTQPKRDLVLFHAATDALKDLLGCIGPVTTLIGDGKGTESRKALEKLEKKVFAALERGEEVALKIHS